MEQKTYQFDEVRGNLIFSETKVELDIVTDEVISGSFIIEEQDGLDMEGYVYSSSFRMHINNPEITDSRTQIDYSFDPKGMNMGDVLKGNFYIVTSRGEFVLPFVAMKQRSILDSSLGQIKNLFHFTNLAKSAWDEAVEIFYNPEFEQIIKGNESKYLNLYRGLKVKGNKNANLEEFLIGVNKKQKIEISVDQTDIRLANLAEDTEVSVNIRKNGWGYTIVNIEVWGDFIRVDRSFLKEADFEGNECKLSLEILADKLHSGKNPGRIILRSQYDEICIDVEVLKSNLFKKNLVAQKQKRVTYALTRHYLDYTVKRINLSKWIMLTDELLAGSSKDNLVYSLMQVHSLLIQERYNEAKWILDKRVVDNIEEADNDVYCYYLYMNALYTNDDYYAKEAAEKIRSIFDQDRTNWQIAWILIKIDEELRRSASKRFAWAVEQVRMGCISPVIYLEAIKALSESPSLLRHMDREEKQIILYGAREGILTPDIMAQVSYLVLKAKNYDSKLLRIMKYIYEKSKSDEALQSVCVQLMKGGKTGPQYFEWYEAAVDKNFPLTKLYESYMMSMDLRRDDPIPKRVLMYFSFQSELPPAQNAYLYAYVVKHRHELAEIYLTYRDSIDRFVLKMLYEGRIDHNLAYLYSNIVLEDMLTEDNLRQFSKILFKHCITVEEQDIVKVIVVDNRVKAEMVYPVENGRAIVGLLGNEYTVLLEDYHGNRYYSTREYDTEKFFVPGKILYKMENTVSDDMLFDLFLCDDSPEFLIVTEKNVDRYRFLESCEAITDEYRGLIRLPLIRFYLEKDDHANVDEILSHIEYDDVNYKDYNEIIRVMLIRGYLDKAASYTICYGTDNIEPKLLVRLAERIIERDGMYETELLTYMLISAFERGKYNEVGITYLSKYARGPIKKLRNIWKAASNFDIDTYEVCERMILQTLKTGAFIGEEAKVLKAYVDGGAKTEVELHYLSYFAHESFVHGRVVDRYIFSEMERIYKVEGSLTDICMIAWLQNEATHMNSYELTYERRELITEFLRILMVSKQIVFPFYEAFKDISANAAQVANRVIVEYKGTPDVKTVINYVISKEHEEAGGYSREDMTDMYGGVYVKQFLLFFGETLQYYITEETGNGPQLTESGTISKNDAMAESTGDRFSCVNDIAIAHTLKDYDTAFKLLEEYKYKEYLVDSIFTPQ